MKNLFNLFNLFNYKISFESLIKRAKVLRNMDENGVKEAIIRSSCLEWISVWSPDSKPQTLDVNFLNKFLFKNVLCNTHKSNIVWLHDLVIVWHHNKLPVGFPCFKSREKAF